MKELIKKAFKLETIDNVQAWNMDLGQVNFLYKSFDMFVVESEMGRKAFRTFDGAFNRFMQTSKDKQLEVITSENEILDIDSFEMMDDLFI